MIKRLLFLFFPLTFLSQTATPSLQVNDTIRFLALGDSYTIGQSVAVNERWPVQLSDSLTGRGIVMDTMRIIATTGWRTDDLLNAVSGQHLQQQHYNLVSLLIGVNNQYQNKPFSQYVTEFVALLDSAITYAQGDRTKVFIVSIPDYAYTPFGQQGNAAQISTELTQYNQYNEHVADSAGVHYFDITPISQQGLQVPAYVASDGLHPSGAQYTEWVKLMLGQITTSPNIVIGLDEKTSQQAIHISPNPCSDRLFVSMPDASENPGYSLELYSLTGQLLLTRDSENPSFSLPTETLPDGVYTLHLHSPLASRIQKVVKLQR